MALLDGILGNASKMEVAELELEFRDILVHEEDIEEAFKVIRDLIVFTDRRMILVDKQGVTGKKREYRSIPYTSITQFAKESRGTFDFDAELKLWVRGSQKPIVKLFKKDESIDRIYQLIGEKLLK